MIDIRRCTISELAATPNFDEVLAEYARESAQAELGHACPQMDTYRTLEATGMFHPIGAFDHEKLAGFILPVVVTLPHYGVVAATIESFFVSPAARKHGVGLRLKAHAEKLASDLGAKAVLFSAPVGGALSRLLSASKGYRHSNDVFIRGLA